jgi:hypothetical protein
MVFTLTVTVAVIGSGAVWFLAPARGLIVYLLVLLFYPQYLAISTGSLDWTTSRIVAISLLLRIITYRVQPADYRLVWMDILILAEYLGDTFAHFLTVPDAALVAERQGGHFLNYVVPYLLVRYSLRSRDDVFRFFRWIPYIALPLAAIGIFQSLTGHNPYAFLRAYSPWDIGGQELDVRYGLYRADGPFGNKAAFGLFFAMALAIHIGGVFADRIRISAWLTRAAVICVGLVSSVTSAPLFAAVVTMGWIGMRPLRKWLPYLFAAFLAFILLVELYSDRHFYHVLTRFSMDKSNAYYRILLIEEALGGGMDGHWFAGYGYVGVGPGTDNTNFHWERKDFVNIYIGKLATGGLLNLIPFLMLNAYYYFALYRASQLAKDFAAHWMIWCFTAGLIGWNVAMMTVGALQQTQMLFAMFMGVIAVWLRILSHETVPELAPVEDSAPSSRPNPPRKVFEEFQRPRESPFKRMQ